MTDWIDEDLDYCNNKLLKIEIFQDLNYSCEQFHYPNELKNDVLNKLYWIIDNFIKK